MSDNYREHSSHDDGAVHVHIHSMKLYVGIFAALVALTVFTVVTAEFLKLDEWLVPGFRPGSGGYNLTLAMVIATVKAGLVVTYFMHLKDDNRFNALIFIGSVLFAGVFLAYTLNDTASRGTTDRYHGVHVDPDTGLRAPGGIDHVFQGEEPEHGIEAPAETAHAEEGASAEHH